MNQDRLKQEEDFITKKMIKYVDTAVTFAEFPDEISLCINLSLCPNHCEGCSEPYLAEDIGEVLTPNKLKELIQQNPGITLVGFMGGDNDHEQLYQLAKYVKEVFHLKIGVYSGRDYLNITLLEVVDYYKIGRWIMPQGDSSSWASTTCGPITFPFSNQVMFKKDSNQLINITERFRERKINDLSSYIKK